MRDTNKCAAYKIRRHHGSNSALPPAEEDWDGPAKVKEKYRSARIIKGSRVVFNIKGNDYRLVVKFNYPYRMIYIRFVGTDAGYDEINVEEV
jgi:mRNA interferase HigB